MAKKIKSETPERQKKTIDMDPEEELQTKADIKSEKKPSKRDELENDLKAEKDKFLRLFAEFENYKKRTTKERIELFKTAGEEILQSLLPVVDDFERALNHLGESEETKELKEGVQLIYNKLTATLKQKGLEPMSVNSGHDFDAEQHEAVTQIPAPEEALKGKIIDVIEKGYKLGDKIIRFPKVVIGQ